MGVRGGGWERALGGELGVAADCQGGRSSEHSELNTQRGASMRKSHAANLLIQSGHGLLPSRHQLRPPRLGVSSLT